MSNETRSEIMPVTESGQIYPESSQCLKINRPYFAESAAKS